MLSAAGLEGGLRHGGYSQLGCSEKDTQHLDVAAFLTRAYWVSQSSEGGGQVRLQPHGQGLAPREFTPLGERCVGWWLDTAGADWALRGRSEAGRHRQASLRWQHRAVYGVLCRSINQLSHWI